MDYSVTAGLRITGEIGRGAIATVVRLVDSTGTAFAGKILHERHRRDPAALRRFEREAELTSTLVHRNLVRVYGIRHLDGLPVLVMELVEGPDLATWLAREGVASPTTLARLARGLAEGLAFAHSQGVIHRDLKPANVLLALSADGPVPKIADFGMARASSFASADRGALTVLGTPHYMAPECLEPLAVDPRADLYALGCILVELATGSPPYGGATPFAVLEQHRSGAVPRLPEIFGPELARLVQRLLAKAPGDRPQSAAAVLDELDRIAGGSGTRALARVDPERTADGHCARCGEPVLHEVRLCFSCGLAQVTVALGEWSVFVWGPGRESNKLDSGLRERLLRWLRANAAHGLDPTPLERKIPRLPFAVVTGVAEVTAQALAASLASLGLQVTPRRGGRFSHDGVVRKVNKLAFRRMTLPAAVLGAPMIVSPIVGAFTLPLIAVVVPVMWGLSMRVESAPAALVTTARASRIPAGVRRKLDELPNIVQRIAARRHRESLRAVVSRVVALVQEAQGDPEIEAEMEHALNLAAGSTLRMDQLESDMTRPEFDPADPAHRQLMHERDMWAARLLDLMATLDAFSARRANARALMRAAEPDDTLDSVRAAVEALEEVQPR
jgi:hypothetical protein